jgi:uncharacterized protein (DUF1015 family)
MADVFPFCGIRYNLPSAGEITELVAPPYDVVDEATRDALLSRNPHNIFHLELPPGRPTDSETCNRYTRARDAFREWSASGILRRDTQPGIYPYEIEFTVNGHPFCRKGFVALIHVELWETRIVRPHERTFDRVTEDRLRLLKSTQGQFSQIFMLYRGTEGDTSIFDSAPRHLLYTVNDHTGNVHRLWRITDREALRGLHSALADAALYIADGHHRYTTALRYSREMQSLCGQEPWRPYNYLMTYLVDASDPGLVVLPTHRLIPLPEGVTSQTLRSKAEGFFERQQVHISASENPEAVAKALSEVLAHQPTQRGIGVAMDSGRTAEVWWLRPEVEDGVLVRRIHPALRRLDVTVLDELVVSELLGIDVEGGKGSRSIRYQVDAEAALRGLEAGEVLFLLRPTPATQVLDVADAGLTMPHKSTYFYPKILTGLVMNSLAPEGREPLLSAELSDIP